MSFEYSRGNWGQSWLFVAALCEKHQPKANKRTRRLALKMYRRTRKEFYRPLLNRGKAWR